ncbi:MAG TPA: hypothetical protein VGK59_04320 [Ohtaekwangia sp.]
MEIQTSTATSWTWADQISSYRFWGLAFFFIFLLVPSMIVNNSITIFSREYGMSGTQIGAIFSFKAFSGFFGIWLAWFLTRLKNHYLLFLYAGIVLSGLGLIYMMPSVISFTIGFFLIGLGFGAIALAIPAIISGGRGGSEMFIVSFGLISFFESLSWVGFSSLFGSLIDIYSTVQGCMSVGMVSAVAGILFLLPVKSDLFYQAPPERNFSLTPTSREPATVALLGFIPIYNVYHMLNLTYRFHGEVNTLNPSRNLLSPRAAVWCSLLLFILSPIIIASVNTTLVSKLKENGATDYHKNWSVILWSFILLPVSFAFIQSNMNQLLTQQAGNEVEQAYNNV